MSGSVLVINCGSSSIKFALVAAADEHELLRGTAERIGGEDARIVWRAGGEEGAEPIAGGGQEAAIGALGDLLAKRGPENGELIAVGHRVAHGGESFTGPAAIDDAVIEAIEACTPLAPLHNPANLLGIRTALRALPGTPQFAVFDTSFHHTLPPEAYLYALPYALYEKHGVRRYGFHGTSHRYVTARAAELLGRDPLQCSFVSAHLGNGCSACAVVGGKSVDTTMGLTPLEGLVMGTRSGDVDPGLHAHLAERLGWSIERIDEVLNRESGLLGLSGVGNDMRELLEAAASGNARAELAIEVFCYRLAKALAALSVAAAGGADALIFTGGIGENAAEIRARTLARLSPLGFEIDDARNADHGEESRGRITRDGGPIALVVPTDEERMIARESLALLGARGART